MNSNLALQLSWSAIYLVQNEDFAQLEDIKKFIVSGAEVDLVVVSEKFDAAQHSANISMKQEAFGELISYLTKQSDFEDFYISLAEDREKQRAKALLDARSKVENQISELQEYIRNNFGSAKGLEVAGMLKRTNETLENKELQFSNS